MGLGLAKSFIRVGHQVLGLDVNEDSISEASEAGVRPVRLASGLSGCDVIVTALPDSPDVKSALSQLPGGKDRLVIDCSTVDPRQTLVIADHLAPKAIRLRDAAMAGGPTDAEAGSLLFLVGCPEPEFDEIRSILEPVSRGVVRCGDTGAGVTMKVVNNLLALSIFLADVEALLIAKAAGLDPRAASAILSTTGASNAPLEGLVNGQLIERRFSGAFRTSLALKDATIAAEMASRLGIPLTALASTAEILRQAVQEGFGDMAAGAAGLVLERIAGVDLSETDQEQWEI